MPSGIKFGASIDISNRDKHIVTDFIFNSFFDGELCISVRITTIRVEILFFKYSWLLSIDLILYLKLFSLKWNSRLDFLEYRFC